MDALRGIHDGTAEHFLYFGMGAALTLVVVLAFVLGIFIGRKQTSEKEKPRQE